MPSAPDRHAMSMLIRKLESIATVSEAERQAIRSLPIRTQTLNARQDIVRDGDKPSHCCLILDGWACRYKLLSQGKRQILSFHIAGDIPDLQSLHIHTMDHSLGTLTQATVAFIPHESLRELTARHPGLAAILWRDTLVDAAIFREWMVGMGRRKAPGKIAHFLCEMYVRLDAIGMSDKGTVPLPITQEELGDSLGLSSVHTNRALQELRGEGLITFERGKLTVHSWDGLVSVGEFDSTYLHHSPDARPAPA